MKVGVGQLPAWAGLQPPGIEDVTGIEALGLTEPELEPEPEPELELGVGQLPGWAGLQPPGIEEATGVEAP